MAIEENILSLNLKELTDYFKKQQEDKDDTEEISGVRTSLFTAESDPRVSTNQKTFVPKLQSIQILKDGLSNPYVKLNWRIDDYNIDTKNILGFNIYRKRFPKHVSEKKINYSRNAYDKVSQGIPRSGKFSENKKGLYQIRRSLIPGSILNSNLDELQNRGRARYNSSLSLTAPHSRLNFNLRESPSVSFKGDFGQFIDSRVFRKLVFVNYTKFLAKAKKKFVFVKEKDFITIDYSDKEVAYGEEYEYCVSTVYKDKHESAKSNAVKVNIEEVIPVGPPVDIVAKQLNETEIQVCVRIDSRDDIAKVLFYRKAENEITFKKIFVADNINDSVTLIDGTISYTKTYIYRVFLESIHGMLSTPKEIEITSTAQKITPYSRSNNLKIPIVNAVQDQNSDSIKIIISANDPSVNYYVLERRDLSIHEKSFSTPGRLHGELPSTSPVYGGEGWENNKFFARNERKLISSRAREPISAMRLQTREPAVARGGIRNRSLTTRIREDISPIKLPVNNLRSAYTEVDNTDTDIGGIRLIRGGEIVFIDNTVNPGHIYQYRVRGYDLFLNPSSYAHSMVKAVGKKSLRRPINLRYEIVRTNPFRIKLTWDGDNLFYDLKDSITKNQDNKQDDNKEGFTYKLQRRQANSSIYETFPIVSEGSIIDEVASLDVISFDTKVNKEQNTEYQLKDNTIERPFSTPGFLEENNIYFYRVAAIAPNGDISNYTKELEVMVLLDLSSPVNLRAQVHNPQVEPLIAKLSWETELEKIRGDHFVIERKFDSASDSFEVIGKEFLKNEFFDRDIKMGNTYIYRIKALDMINRESKYSEVRLSI